MLEAFSLQKVSNQFDPPDTTWAEHQDRPD